MLVVQLQWEKMLPQVYYVYHMRTECKILSAVFSGSEAPIRAVAAR
jgi:hypothetical protein